MLLNLSEFRAQLQADKKTPFCPGIPGASKTILTAVIVKHLINQYYNNLNISIAYIYCNFERTNEQTLKGLLASLLKQLTESQSSLPRSVTELYERYNIKRTRPSTTKLLKTLLAVTVSYLKVFVLINALNKCQVNRCRPRLIEDMFNCNRRCHEALMKVIKDA